jgi:hypothetical protein
LPDCDGQVHDALLLDFLEQNQESFYLTDATFCSVSLGPNVRKNRFKCSATAPVTCPVRAVEAWLKVLPTADGPLFRAVDRHGRIHPTRLTAQSVALVVKKLIANAGIPADYAGHSLRAGLATAAAAGVPERAIMAQTGHRSLATLRKYIREGSLFLENAAAKVGL